MTVKQDKVRNCETSQQSMIIRLCIAGSMIHSWYLFNNYGLLVERNLLKLIVYENILILN